MRCLAISPMRYYIRHAPCTVGKGILWDKIASHLWWLESYTTVETTLGTTFRVDARDPVGRYLYYFGSWEPNLTYWIKERLLPGDGFIDVGANLGYYSVLASSLVGQSGSVVAVEPLPRTFRVLEANLNSNRAYNVRPVNVAAWDRRDLVKFFTDSDAIMGASTVVSTWADKWRLKDACEVQAAPLPAILTGEEIRAARLIKIDVEGAEWHVLSGLRPVIQSFRRDLEIVVEVTPKLLEQDGHSADELQLLLHEWGFHPYQIKNDCSGAAYFCPGAPSNPKRVERIASLGDQVEIVFSRIDGASL
jgi:FkbM family methyltransferase